MCYFISHTSFHPSVRGAKAREGERREGKWGELGEGGREGGKGEGKEGGKEVRGRQRKGGGGRTGNMILVHREWGSVISQLKINFHCIRSQSVYPGGVVVGLWGS